MSGHSSLLSRAHKLKRSTHFTHTYEKFPIGDFLVIANKNLSLIFFIEEGNIKESVYNDIKSDSVLLKGANEESREYLKILQEFLKMGQHEIVDSLLEI